MMDRIGSIKPSWNTTRMLVRGPLTDRKIEQYRKQGWYSAEFRAQRATILARKKHQFRNIECNRDGNWIIDTEGRMIFSPL